MTPLDADIARLLAIAHARRTLGWAWYGPEKTPAVRRRPTARAEREGKAAWRAKGKAEE